MRKSIKLQIASEILSMVVALDGVNSALYKKDKGDADYWMKQHDIAVDSLRTLLDCKVVTKYNETR